MSSTSFELETLAGIRVLRLVSDDGTNRLTRDFVLSLRATILELSRDVAPLVIAGNNRFFSAGADLREIAQLDRGRGYEFSQMGQALMTAIENFPAPLYAAISGYCMGGGLDLALACRHRITSSHGVFGHRGAALGLITGWGGTQRLPRLIGKARALEMFVAADKVNAAKALQLGLVDALADDPVAAAIRRIQAR
jgi:enoyl-CoA hydratase/carnithine racemase